MMQALIKLAGGIVYTYSKHALQQMQRRCVGTADVEEVLSRGRVSHQRANREVYFLGRPDNLAVVVEGGDVIVTVVRTASLKRFRRNADVGRTMHI